MKLFKKREHKSRRDFVDVYTPVTIQVWAEKWHDIFSHRPKGS